MAGETPVDYDSLQPLIDRIRSLEEQVRTLQQPTGTSLAGLVNQVKQAIINIGTTVTAYLASGFTTGSMTATGNVQVNGAQTIGGKLSAIDVYSRTLTYGGLYKVVYVHQDGTIGFVSSSRRFKQDIQPAEIADLRLIMRELRIVTFRYIQAVENLGEDAATEWGVIAEEIDELGLTWLVEYDEDGLPAGVRHERFAFLALLDAQDKQTQIDSITERLDQAGL